MTVRSFFSAVWHCFRLLFILALGLLFGYKCGFLSGTLTTNWITPAAIFLSFFGGVLNLIAVILNRGKMPVRGMRGGVPEHYQPTHESMHHRTRVPYLGDWIRIGVMGGTWHISPGDVGIYVGLAVFAVDQVLRLLL